MNQPFPDDDRTVPKPEKAGPSMALLFWIIAAAIPITVLLLLISCLVLVSAPGFDPGIGVRPDEPLHPDGTFESLIPQWSADSQFIVVNELGRLLAFDVDREAAPPIWIAPKREGRQYAPSVSPQGRVAYENYETSEKLFEEPLQRHIETAPMDGESEVRQLYELPKTEYNSTKLVWSPDGVHLAFIVPAARDAVPFDIVVTDTDGEESARFPLTAHEGLGHIQRLVWSNDSKRIAVWHAFLGRGTGTSGWYAAITTINKDGTDEKVLARSDYYLSPPTWSPDSTRVYFAMREVGKPNPVLLKSVRVGGTAPNTVAEIDTERTGEVKDIQLSPDGARFLFIIDDEDWRRVELGPGGTWPQEDENTWKPLGGLYVSDVDGDNLTKVAEGALWATWSPDSGRIAAFDERSKQLDLYTATPDGFVLRTIR